MSDPAFLFYPNDYLGGTMGMTFEEKGAYIELLMMQFNLGHLQESKILKMLGSSSELWESIKLKFVIDENGLYYNKRLEYEQIKRRKYSESRRNNKMGKNQHSKSGHMLGHMTTHMIGHMENENENRNKDININKESITVNTKKEEKSDWRNSFDVYKEELKQAYISLINDVEYIKQRQSYHNNLDIPKSLEKACVDYWATEEGWAKKKKSKSKTIDWRSTFNNALSLQCNQVRK
jgi:uncharacterized protein YdaU (DUF1376 family)